MLVEFSVGNFWSFKEIQTLQMRAAKISSKYPKLDEDNVVVVDEQLSLLKSKAVFGANGSGKSNLVRAMEVMFYILSNGVKDMEVLKKSIIPFSLDDETINAPSYFQIIFIFEDILFRYGFEADVNSVHSEWLFGKPLKSEKNVRERQYFIREGVKAEVNKSVLKEAEKIKKTGEKALFLTVLAAWEIQLPLKIIHFFQNNIFLIFNKLDAEIRGSTSSIAMLVPHFYDKITDLLKAIDPTIQGVQNIVNELGTGRDKFVDVGIVRNVNSSKNTQKVFSLSVQEAEGTKKIFEFSSYIFLILEKGGTLIIDEFDAKLHPQLTRKIVELFHSPSTNPHNAQLIFITHDSNLLDSHLLRRDQISFAQKDKNGATELYSLVEFKGVRNDASFEKDYLQGKYYAVPTNLNQLDAIFESH